MFSRLGEIHAQISLMPRLVLISKPLFLPFKVKNLEASEQLYYHSI